MSLPLSHPYVCRDGAPIIDRVDPRIFVLTFFARCMDCTFCHDACCRYGVDVELTRMREIERHAPDLEAYLGIPRGEWFRTDPDDIGILPEPSYPGGAYTRTGVVDLPPGRSAHGESGCVFLDPHGRGCRLHRYALHRGIDVYSIKPMMCLLFPLSFEEGEFRPTSEFGHADLVCQGPGASVYRAARGDLLHYFGPELVAELDRMERQVAAADGQAIPLPVSS